MPMNPPASCFVARRLIQKYKPTSMNSGSSPPMTLQKVVPVLVPVTVTLCRNNVAARVLSFSAVGIRDW